MGRPTSALAVTLARLALIPAPVCYVHTGTDWSRTAKARIARSNEARQQTPADVLACKCIYFCCWDCVSINRDYFRHTGGANGQVLSRKLSHDLLNTLFGSESHGSK